MGRRKRAIIARGFIGVIGLKGRVTEAQGGALGVVADKARALKGRDRMSAMPQSLSDVLVHIVFSTKNRTPWITPEIRRELYPYLGAVIRDMGCVPIQIGGVDDHIHALLVLSRTITIAQVIEKMKTPTSKWLKTKGVPGFAWQGGYGAFSVSASLKPVVVAYIKGQEEHHRRVSFQEEFRALLEEHGIAWDERYVWD